ncbi:unnamed protein product [Rhodiola kirilowii]
MDAMQIALPVVGIVAAAMHSPSTQSASPKFKRNPLLI